VNLRRADREDGSWKQLSLIVSNGGYRFSDTETLAKLWYVNWIHLAPERDQWRIRMYRVLQCRLS